jgi:hypothetical protein
VAFGLALLVIGLVAYASIPTIHTTPIVNEQSVWTQEGILVQGQGLYETPRNITMFPGANNTLHVNVTQLQPTGSSPIRFKLYELNKSQTCPATGESPVLIDRSLSDRQPFNLTLTSGGTYCFVFDNQDSQSPSSIDVSAWVSSQSDQVVVSRDGSANTAGLGLGALGLAVALYGYSRKTVIPWE